MMIKFFFRFSLFQTFLLFGIVNAYSQNGKIYNSSAVVCAHPSAAKVGEDILKAGGNAVDAAVAVHFALAVVYPNAGNLGGGGFMLYRDKNGKFDALDFRETAPHKSKPTMFLDDDGKVFPGLSLKSHLAAGVPGSVAGILEAHRKYGSISLSKLIQPAIDLAKIGFPITQMQADEMNELRNEFIERNEHCQYLVEFKKWKAGQILIQEDLTKVLERIQKDGHKGFYEGLTADLIADEMNRGGGIVDREDLKNYKPIWREPISGNYKELKIVSMPPPSSGGTALIQLLKLVEPFDLKGKGLLNPEYVNLMCEAEKLVYADRAFYQGDPDFVKVPVKSLISDKYAAERRKLIKPGKAIPSDSIQNGKVEPESEQTTHFSIVDKYGNAVSLTTTLNDSYGSKIFVAGAGFLLNNQMDDFSIKPGHANLYGLTGDAANSIQAGKRMLSSMTPTIIEKNGKLWMVVGSPGGSTIITSVFQNILNVYEHGLSMNESVSTKRFHHQWNPDLIYFEHKTFAKKSKKALKKIGYSFKERKPIGRVDAILVLPDGKLEAAPDPRGDDSVGGE